LPRLLHWTYAPCGPASAIGLLRSPKPVDALAAICCCPRWPMTPASRTLVSRDVRGRAQVMTEPARGRRIVPADGRTAPWLDKTFAAVAA
jgi:hypothetical protein